MGRESGFQGHASLEYQLLLYRSTDHLLLPRLALFKPEVRLINTYEKMHKNSLGLLDPGRALCLWLHPCPAGVMATNLDWLKSLSQSLEQCFPNWTQQGVSHVWEDKRITWARFMSTKLNELNYNLESTHATFMHTKNLYKNIHEVQRIIKPHSNKYSDSPINPLGCFFLILSSSHPR